MPKSLSELIRELQIEFAALKANVASLDKSFDDYDVLGIRDRLARVEVEIAELRRAQVESERKRWQTTLLFLGSLATLIVQLILLFAKK